MIRFDTSKLEKEFPELEIIIAKDDDGKLFTVYRLREGKFSYIPWSLENISVDPDTKMIDADVINYVKENPIQDENELTDLQVDYLQKFMEFFLS